MFALEVNRNPALEKLVFKGREEIATIDQGDNLSWPAQMILRKGGDLEFKGDDRFTAKLGTQSFNFNRKDPIAPDRLFRFVNPTATETAELLLEQARADLMNSGVSHFVNNHDLGAEKRSIVVYDRGNMTEVFGSGVISQRQQNSRVSLFLPNLRDGSSFRISNCHTEIAEEIISRSRAGEFCVAIPEGNERNNQTLIQCNITTESKKVAINDFLIMVKNGEMAYSTEVSAEHVNFVLRLQMRNQLDPGNRLKHPLFRQNQFITPLIRNLRS